MVDALTATDQAIVRAINTDSIDAENLVSREGWIRLCAVRGRHYRAVDEEAWQDLCAKRGYLQLRRNSRGF